LDCDPRVNNKTEANKQLKTNSKPIPAASRLRLKDYTPTEDVKQLLVLRINFLWY